jgi:hypothetical protein
MRSARHQKDLDREDLHRRGCDERSRMFDKILRTDELRRVRDRGPRTLHLFAQMFPILVKLITKGNNSINEMQE